MNTKKGFNFPSILPSIHDPMLAQRRSWWWWLPSVVGVDDGNPLSPQPSRSHRCPVAPSSKVPLLLGAIVSGAESLLLTSSFSESFSDSAELDSSSDSSPFPNNNNDGWMDGGCTVDAVEWKRLLWIWFPPFGMGIGIDYGFNFFRCDSSYPRQWVAQWVSDW